MAQLFRDFEAALAAFDERGGAMLHYPASPSEPDGWHVGSAEEIADMTDESPREATGKALDAGGLDDEQIEATLAYWQH